MATRTDFPPLGVGPETERRSDARTRVPGAGRVMPPFERRSGSRDGLRRPWRRALSTGRAPFPGRRN